jgi:hypothetical protein
MMLHLLAQKCEVSHQVNILGIGKNALAGYRQCKKEVHIFCHQYILR